MTRMIKRVAANDSAGRGMGSFFTLFLISLTVLSVDLLFFRGGNDSVSAQSATAPALNRVVLLAFTSEHCPACQTLEPLVAGFEKKNYPIKRLSPQNSADMALYRQFQIETMPSFVLLVDGQETDRLVCSGEGPASVQSRLLGMFQTAGQQVATLPASSAPNSNQETSTSQNSPASVTPTAPETMHTTPNDPTKMAAATMIPNEMPDRNDNITPVGFTAPAEKGPVASTVRLRVGNGESETDSGTGTLIHANESGTSREGLILTCGHLFRDSGGKSPVAVDLVNPSDGRPVTVTGECVFYDDDLDIGFVGIPLPFSMKPAKLVPPGYLPHNGDAVVSVGCSAGEDPSVWEHSIVSSDKKFYQPKDPNSQNHPFYFIEVSNAPKPGRSGGGLFVRSETGDYYLLGVCNAGDPKTDEGYFLPASVVYDQLFANRNLAFVYEDILRAQGDGKSGGLETASFNDENPGADPNAFGDLQSPDRLSLYNQTTAESTRSAALTGNESEGIRPVRFDEHRDGDFADAEDLPADGVVSAGKNGGQTGVFDSGSDSPLVAGVASGTLTPMPPMSGKENPQFDAGLEELRRCHRQGAEIICIVNWPKSPDSKNKESDVIKLSQP